MAHHDAKEAALGRNPHGDFKAIEASRPPYPNTPYKWVQKPEPAWSFGQGANKMHSKAEHKYVEIDPYSEGRQPSSNYKLLISAIVPRPIGFCSTISKDGVKNLAPFSYFNVINHDPPLFVFGFSASYAQPKDSLRNLMDSKECTINIFSPSFIEAANSTSANIPADASEWELSGLTPEPSKTVKPPRVKEAIFAVEAVLVSTTEFQSKSKPGQASGVLAVVEGQRFWCREDAIDEKRELVDPAVLRPIGRMGGIQYGLVTEGFEIPRPNLKEWEEWKNDKKEEGKI